MRRTAVLRALIGIACASATVLACGDNAAPPDPPPDLPTSTPYPEPPAPTAYVPRNQRITMEVVERLLPSPGETSAALGISSGEWSLEPGIGLISDESEAFRLARSGITAGWVATFKPGAAFGLSLFFHDSPEDAERTYQHQRGVFGLLEEQETIADRFAMLTWGRSADVPVTSTFIFMRQQTVAAIVSMTHDDDQDVRLSLREFARMLALGIDKFVRSQGP